MAMGLQLSNRPLEERLSGLDEAAAEKLAQNLASKDIRQAKSPYYKHELVHRIVHYFRDKGVQFGDSYLVASDYLNRSINKEPLKAVERGMRVKGIPSEFLERLDDFEKIYFFAGVDKLKEAPAGLQAMDGYEIASVYIRAGIDQIAYMHNSITKPTERKRKVTRGRRREVYENLWSPPHSKEIRERLLARKSIFQRMEKRYAPLYQEFGSLFQEEDRLHGTKVDLFTMGELDRMNLLDGLRERIALKLDSLKIAHLKALELKCGAARLGDYAQINS